MDNWGNQSAARAKSAFGHMAVFWERWAGSMAAGSCMSPSRDLRSREGDRLSALCSMPQGRADGRALNGQDMQTSGFGCMCDVGHSEATGQRYQRATFWQT